MGTVAPAPLTSFRPGIPDFGVILQLWDSICSLLPESNVLGSVAAPFQTSDLNGAVSWGKVVFLTSCFITMAGCGILSSLLRRRSQEPPSETRRWRLQNKRHSRGSSGIITSSEEEDGDSSESPRHTTDSVKEKGVSSHHCGQPEDGMPSILIFEYGLIIQQLPAQIPGS